MSERIPVRRSISGEGRSRVMVRLATKTWTSAAAGATYTSTTLIEGMGATKAISSTTSPDTVDFSVAHGLALGDRVYISGHSQSEWNNEWTVAQVVDTDTIKIAERKTTSGTGGTGQWAPDFRRIRVGMRAVSTITRGGSLPALETYGIITALDTAAKQLTFAGGWVNGTPTTGNTYYVDGYCIDLPRSSSTVQTFSPDMLTHELWRSRLATKFFGYRYAADFTWRWLSADHAVNFARFINLGESDTLTIIPHVDQLGFQYNVILADALNLEPFGIAGGYKDFRVRFRGMELYPFPVLDGYGSNYATEYGPYL